MEQKIKNILRNAPLTYDAKIKAIADLVKSRLKAKEIISIDEEIAQREKDVDILRAKIYKLRRKMLADTEKDLIEKLGLVKGCKVICNGDYYFYKGIFMDKEDRIFIDLEDVWGSHAKEIKVIKELKKV